MVTLAKVLIKRLFPKLVLRWRANNVIYSRMDPDLYLLANIRTILLSIPSGNAYIQKLSKSSTVIDVGACGGEYSIIMGEMFDRVLTIEPTADMAAVLRESLPQNCEIIECALGDSIGEVVLRVPKVEGARLHALATVAEHGFDFSNIGMVDTATVKQLTIDKLMSERNTRPSFMKIDVEGYEGKVLLGALKVIEDCKPVLMVEIEKRHNKEFGDIFGLLGSRGYLPYHYRSGKLCLSGPEVVEDSYTCLKENEVSGMTEVMAIKKAERYINNFLFLPVA
jgi:FkbM family methyltransferase